MGRVRTHIRANEEHKAIGQLAAALYAQQKRERQLPWWEILHRAAMDDDLARLCITNARGLQRMEPGELKEKLRGRNG